jgi:hypothetical protein
LGPVKVLGFQLDLNRRVGFLLILNVELAPLVDRPDPQNYRFLLLLFLCLFNIFRRPFLSQNGTFVQIALLVQFPKFLKFLNHDLLLPLPDALGVDLTHVLGEADEKLVAHLVGAVFGH